MLVYSGRSESDITELLPSGLTGRNGTQDGLGIYFTDNIDAAIRYAGKEGSVYLTYLPDNNVLTIDEKTTFSTSQQAVIQENFKELPHPLQLRLATDISGHKVSTFSYDNENQALEAYKSAKKELAGLRLPDRCMPNVEFEAEHIELFTPHNKLELNNVSTKDFHYRIALADNRLVNHFLSPIADTLKLTKNDGEHHYLSFRAREKVLANYLPNQLLPSKERTEFLEALNNLTGEKWLAITRPDPETWEPTSPKDIGATLLKEYHPNSAPQTSKPTSNNTPEMRVHDDINATFHRRPGL
jgi:hypothetical protein